MSRSPFTPARPSKALKTNMSDSDSSSLKTDIVSTPNSEIRNLIGRLKICMYWKAKKQTVSFFFLVVCSKIDTKTS